MYLLSPALRVELEPIPTVTVKKEGFTLNIFNLINFSLEALVWQLMMLMLQVTHANHIAKLAE